MIDMEVYVYIGLHKTGSTYLQKNFFPLYKNACGYVSLRHEARSFLNYVVNVNDIEFDPENARDILKEDLEAIGFTNNKIVFCDEILCGAPWDNAKDRVRYVNRLVDIFTDPCFIVAFRKQEDLVESLYNEYIKKGGSASLEEFLHYDRLALKFSGKFYLDFGLYYSYIKNLVGEDNVLCLYYEDLVLSPIDYFDDVSSFIGFELDEKIHSIISKRSNPSISGLNALFLRYINKLCRSERQPFLLFPHFVQKVFLKLLIAAPRFEVISKEELIREFCAQPKKNNVILPGYSANLSKLGY